MNTYSKNYFSNPLRARYSMSPALRELIVGLPPNSKVLDLGCGDMRLLKEIAAVRSDLQLHGVDIGEIVSESDQIRFTNADVTTFTAEDEQQLVLAIDILEHLQQPERLVRTAYNSLESKGLFYTMVPSVTKLILFNDENFFSDYSHVRPFSCKSMTRMLSDHGFELSSTESIGRFKKSLARLFYYLTRGLVTFNPAYLNGAIKMMSGTSIETIARKKL